MTLERTEIEWTYEPVDLFEAPYQHAGVDFNLLVDAGRAVATLGVPQQPVPPDVEERIRAEIDSIFLVRQLQVHRRYRLEGPKFYQHSTDHMDIGIRIGSTALLTNGASVDFVRKDAAGNIISDSRAERIAEHKLIVNSVAPKLVRSATLRSMFQSYSRAVSDPNDELVHLYEIRDALSDHYGSEQSAGDALGISEGEWRRLRVLANVEPLEQGRHRGKHPVGRRPATEGELNEARQLVRRWMMAFAKTI